MAKTAKRSSGAVEKAWGIFGKMSRAKRSDVLAACEKAGINLNTAKTQYHRYKHRND